MAMVRRSVRLPAGLDRALAVEARRRGMSQAALIRCKLLGLDAILNRPTSPADERLRQEALRALRKIRRATKEGPGSGERFNREELYAERLDRIGRG